jgi:hypothetical protein
MVFSLEHDIKVTKNHQNLLPTQSVLVAHTVLSTGFEFFVKTATSFGKMKKSDSNFLRSNSALQHT